MARDPLFWIATTVRGLVNRVDELNAMLVKAGPPGVHLAEALFVFDPNAPEFVPSILPGVHVRADPPLVFHSALEHAEAVLHELLQDVIDRTDVPHVAPQDLLPVSDDKSDDQAKKEKKVHFKDNVDDTNMYFDELAEHDVDDDGDEDDSDEWRLRQIMGNKEYENMVDSMAAFDDEFEDG